MQITSIIRRRTLGQRPPFSKRQSDVARAMPTASPVSAAVSPKVSAFASDAERIASFGRALDALRNEAEASLGATDVAHIQRVRSLSRRLELASRTLLHFSFEPVGFALATLGLTGHKLLELIEVGHTALHGTYDHCTELKELHSATFYWKAPIDEGSWRTGHNLRHHQFTNVFGRDPDLDFGVLRLSASVPFQNMHRLQPISNLSTWLYFSTAINAHVTGLIERYLGQTGRSPSRRDESSWSLHRRGFRKLARYYGREYVLFPALAGPFFWKVLAGNIASEIGRDLYAGATIYCGHVGATEFPEGTHAKSRAEWYVMQVEGSRDFEVTGWTSLLCGGLERQIEHHLFSRLPPNRLREIAPRVRSICEEHGVTYRSDTWPRVLREVFARLTALRSQDAKAN